MSLASLSRLVDVLTKRADRWLKRAVAAEAEVRRLARHAGYAEGGEVRPHTPWGSPEDFERALAALRAHMDARVDPRTVDQYGVPYDDPHEPCGRCAHKRADHRDVTGDVECLRGGPAPEYRCGCGGWVAPGTPTEHVHAWQDTRPLVTHSPASHRWCRGCRTVQVLTFGGWSDLFRLDDRTAPF